MTENISRGGVSFVSDRRVTAGQSIRLVVTLPRHLIAVRGEGQVVRVEPRTGGYGVSVRLEEPWPERVRPPDELQRRQVVSDRGR